MSEVFSAATTMPSFTDSCVLAIHTVRTRPGQRSKPSSSSFSPEAVGLAPRVRPLAGAHPTGTASPGGARVHWPGTPSLPRVPGSHPKASGPLSPPLPERPLQYGGTGGVPPPRVRFRLPQDLLTPRL